MTRLIVRAGVGLLQLAIVMAVVMFGAAGTLEFWQAWLYEAVFVACSLAITIDLARRDRALLERRLRAGPTAERSATQRVIQAVAAVVFLALLALPCLDVRWHGARVPAVASIAACVVVAIGFAIIGAVFRANTFTSATIEVAADQQVITSGPYRHVRHPMYAGALVLIAATPIALGSWWSLVMIPVFAAVLVWRLRDEERQLAVSLPGYTAYLATTRARLIPGVW